MATPQIDLLFETLLITDEDDDNDILILEQVISGLDDYELKTCLSVAKKYRKNYGWFCDKLLAEKELRTA